MSLTSDFMDDSEDDDEYLMLNFDKVDPFLRHNFLRWICLPQEFRADLISFSFNCLTSHSYLIYL